MKIFRNRVRSLVLVCAVAGLFLGTNLASALRLTALVPSVKAANPVSPVPVANPNPGGTTQACPPATIDGTIGSGSTDWPFVTGTQTSRLFRDAVESSCGTAKPTPSLTDVGSTFKYDAFTFSNTSILSLCITVLVTAGGNGQILAAAYQDSFNPADVQSHYLGDTGNSDKVRSFSFIVNGNSPFVIVLSRVNNATNPPSLGYSFKVLGLPGCEHCPPMDISGTIGSTQTDYPKATDTQTGRLFRNNVLPACGTTKPTPSIEDPTTQFTYDAFTFLNNALTSSCVTVTTTAGAPNQLLTAVYLDRYNPFDVQENYLGDSGNSDQSRTFSVTVPGRRSFVVVVARVNTAANPPSLSYNIGVSGLFACNCTATLSRSSQSFPDVGGQGTFNVNAPAGCRWTVDTFNSQFITITGGAGGGTGNGTVTYTVAPHTGTSRRTGVIAAGGKTFTVFQGFRFADVPLNSTFYTEIGKLSARSITSGCSPGNYCPGEPVLREQMAAFIIRSLGFFSFSQTPPQRFSDVTTVNVFYNFIDKMAELGITSGCGNGNYCPSNPVLREQMAAFIVRALGEPDPPEPPSQRFVDVPTNNQFYRFIDRLATLNITQGCSSVPPRFCPSDIVTRDQMAAFLVRAFDL